MALAWSWWSGGLRCLAWEGRKCIRRYGLLPARAGFPQSVILSRSSSWVHPHVCRVSGPPTASMKHWMAPWLPGFGSNAAADAARAFRKFHYWRTRVAAFHPGWALARLLFCHLWAGASVAVVHDGHGVTGTLDDWPIQGDTAVCGRLHLNNYGLVRLSSSRDDCLELD